MAPWKSTGCESRWIFRLGCGLFSGAAMYVSFREFQLSVGWFNRQWQSDRPLRRQPGLGAGLFFGCPAWKNHGDFEKTNDFGEFLEGDISPKKLGRSRLYISHVLSSLGPGATISTRRAFCKGCLGIATNGAGGGERAVDTLDRYFPGERSNG